MLFNGTNPNSVVIMNNCSIHHLHDVIRLSHSVGALVLFPLIRQIKYQWKNVLAKSSTSKITNVT